MKYAEYIKDRFAGQAVHVVASGPSMYGFDYRRFHRRIVLATNHAYKCLQRVGVECYVVFNDVHFLREDDQAVLKTNGVRILAAAQTGLQEAERVTLYDFINTGFTPDPADGVFGRELAGATALCIALQGGARRVYLWGMDCRELDAKETRRAAGINGANSRDLAALETMDRETGFFMHATDGQFNHSVQLRADAHLYRDKVRVFDSFPTENVFNMSRFSLIDRFPSRLPEEVLPW